MRLKQKEFGADEEKLRENPSLRAKRSNPPVKVYVLM